MSPTQRRPRTSYVPLLACLACLATSGCARSKPQDTTHAKFFENAKFVSLAPSNTELIYALQAQGNLIGVCNQCDQPQAAKSKPQVGSFISVNLERLAQLKPAAAFLVDGQESLASVITRQSSLNCRPIVLHNRTIGDIAHNVEEIGADTGKGATGSQLAGAFRRQVQELRQITNSGGKPVRVFLCVWPTPLMAAGAGSYMNDVITACGGNNIAGSMPAAYVPFNVEQLLVQQPDVVILPHEAMTEDFYKKSPWTSLKAIANHRLYFLPDRAHDYLSRPTLRLCSGLYWLASRLHPEKTAALQSWRAHAADVLQPVASLPDE